MKLKKLIPSFPICVVLLGILLVIVGCQMNSAPSKINTNNIVYFEDERTGLCFAAINSYTGHSGDITVITNVPCTDKVKALIQYNKERE